MIEQFYLNLKWDPINRDQSGPGRNGNERVIHIPPSSITRAWPSDAVLHHIRILLFLRSVLNLRCCESFVKLLVDLKYTKVFIFLLQILNFFSLNTNKNKTDNKQIKMEDLCGEMTANFFFSCTQKSANSFDISLINNLLIYIYIYIYIYKLSYSSK